MTITLESLERAARRALEEDDTVPATRRDLEPPPHLFLLEHQLAEDAATRDAQVRVRLDALRDRASGPYVVNGRSVRARPMFRSEVAHRHPRTEVPAHVEKIGGDAGIPPSRIHHLHYGQGLPTDLVRLTQALLDADRLPPIPGDLGARIRHMQWECGVGFDQAGYAREALRVVNGFDPGFYGPGLETFHDLDRKRFEMFEPVALADLRAGDLVVLREQIVVLYRVETVDDERLERYRVRGAAVPSRPHRVFEVDGSWDAGSEGGFRRDTWILDDETKTWGSWDSSSGRFTLSKEGPADESLSGAYRIRR